MSESTSGATELARAANEFMQCISQGMAALANVGDVAIGSATKDAVFSEDKVTLYRYRPSEVMAPELRVGTLLLICYALVNHPYMMDLQADRSLIRGLLQRDVDVYLVNWAIPTARIVTWRWKIRCCLTCLIASTAAARQQRLQHA